MTLTGPEDEMVVGWIVLPVDYKEQLYAVQFADGHYEPRICASKLVLDLERDWRISGRDVRKPILPLGTTVMAQTHYGCFSGIITHINEDNTFSVQSDFGDYFPKINMNCLEPYD